ncbi:hypothetical protein ALC57_01796 [Trachymyrmex cornetzi]|uniref:Uncharacterized protein n=1 Tax=Trachymyrmex cornetzi TaxID=471704 RepID=A0A195EKR9_9HYME|nr:hypothetical protein ALC57_01796 [Trachymyrmex cornetzi]
MVALVVTEGGRYIEEVRDVCTYVYSVPGNDGEVPYSAVRKPQHGRNEQLNCLEKGIVGNLSMPKTFKIGSKVEMLRRYKNLQSIPTRIHHDGVPHKAVACFYRESRVIRLCVLALLIGLAEAAFIPVYPRSSPCLPEREPTSLSLWSSNRNALPRRFAKPPNGS